MNRQSRRAFIRVIAIAAILPALACSKSTSAALADAANTADIILKGFMTPNVALGGLTPLAFIGANFPHILPATTLAKITNAAGTGYLDLATADLANLKTQLAVGIPDTNGASILQSIETYINTAVNLIAPILTAGSAIPGAADAIAMIRDIIAALPIIEAFVNALIPRSSKVASARAAGLPSAGQPIIAPRAALADLQTRLGGR